MTLKASSGSHMALSALAYPAGISGVYLGTYISVISAYMEGMDNFDPDANRCLSVNLPKFG